MQKINKTNIPIEYKWFADKLDNNFELILGDKSKVIFGFNGIGKSTLCKILQGLNFSNVEFLDYDQQKNSLINNDEIRLSYQIKEISRLEKEIYKINNDLQIDNLLKNNGLGNKSIRKKVHPELEIFYKNNKFPKFKLPKTDTIKFLRKYKNLNFKNFFTYYCELYKISKADEELEKNNKQKLYDALKLIKSSVDSSEKECPLCDTVIDWQSSLDKKIEELSDVKSELIEKYQSKKGTITVEELNFQLSALAELKANENLAFDVAIASSEEEYEKIASLQSELEDKIKERNSLLTIAHKKFNLVLSKKEYLENDLKRYFNVEKSNITYDTKNDIITIKFPREIKNYSTGEINLITFLYSVYSFLGSDKDTLVLDDPVSSLDIINQYKIAFEIVNNISTDKSMLVLTHSTDFLNIINSQYPKQFEFMYLEQSNGIIYIDKIDYINLNDNPNIITLDKIKNCDNDGLIEYIKKRDSDTSIDFEVLHYSDSEHFIDGDSNKLSNYGLINLIDNFTSFTHKDFYENSYNKIKYLAAIRVWIEKQLFNSINPTDISKQKEYLAKNTIDNRISFLIPRGENLQINGKTITREQLMCKKVMLNQGIHYNSQIAPFAYAINLSLDELQKEINSIRDIFN